MSKRKSAPWMPQTNKIQLRPNVSIEAKNKTVAIDTALDMLDTLSKELSTPYVWKYMGHVGIVWRDYHGWGYKVIWADQTGEITYGCCMSNGTKADTILSLKSHLIQYGYVANGNRDDFNLLEEPHRANLHRWADAVDTYKP